MAFPIEIIALNRLAFGSNGADVEPVQAMGLRQWVQQQLTPDDSQDAECQRRIQQAMLRIHYGAGKDYAALDEVRPLASLNAPIETLWPLTDNKRPMAYQERTRPRNELVCATLIRAVYSHWQLREVMCDFWHNHFSVYGADAPVAVALPTYDREVIRPYCFGNFREMLEAVGSSTAMLYFLNNRSSRAGIANENYARELFELHTLGRDHYLNEFYNRWREVPGALKGKPVGYIDQDVYEAARAFTGWAVEDGSGLGGVDRLPATGKFSYVASWHDNYQKRVLGVDFDPFQSSMVDGRKVLDLLAAHPATAEYLCTKLCRRLVSDTPSKALIGRAADVWKKHEHHPDQIGRVVEFIALSAEFAQTSGAKVKRPLELVASYVRATSIDFEPTEGLMGEMDAAGQHLFAWTSPTGHPDNQAYWTSTNAMRRRWSLVMGLTDNYWKTGVFEAAAAFSGSSISTTQVIDYWQQRLLNATPNPQMATAISDALGLTTDQPIDLTNRDKANQQIRHIAAFVAMSPDFQLR